MGPHADVHRRNRHDRRVGREQKGRREIVGDAGGHLRHQVGGRRADDDQIGGTAQFDMAHAAALIEAPQVGMNRAGGERGQAERRDEMRAAGGQHRRDGVPGAAQRAGQLERLERRDTAADDQKDARHRSI